MYRAGRLAAIFSVSVYLERVVQLMSEVNGAERRHSAMDGTEEYVWQTFGVKRANNGRFVATICRTRTKKPLLCPIESSMVNSLQPRRCDIALLHKIVAYSCPVQAACILI